MMGKYGWLVLAVLATMGANSACEITVHEKTPDCYVSQDDKGCIDIGNEKPKCDKDKKVCTVKIPGCETQTEY